MKEEEEEEEEQWFAPSSPLLGLERPRHVALRRGRGKRRRRGRGKYRKPLPSSPLAAQFLEKVVDILVVVRRLKWFWPRSSSTTVASSWLVSLVAKQNALCSFHAQDSRHLILYGPKGQLCCVAFDVGNGSCPCAAGFAGDDAMCAVSFSVVVRAKMPCIIGRYGPEGQLLVVVAVLPSVVVRPMMPLSWLSPSFEQLPASLPLGSLPSARRPVSVSPLCGHLQGFVLHRLAHSLQCQGGYVSRDSEQRWLSTVAQQPVSTPLKQASPRFVFTL